MKVLLFGAGFLGSHIVLDLIPFVDEFIVVDRELVQPENYDNSLYPIGFIGKYKTLALASLLRILTRKRIILYNKNIVCRDDLLRIIKLYKPDLIIVSVDNVDARKLAKEVVVENNIPCLFVGVTENHVYIDWDKHVIIPSDRESVEEAIHRVRDVCTRVDFRPLAGLVQGLVAIAIKTYIDTRRKNAYIASIDNKGRIHVETIVREEGLHNPLGRRNTRIEPLSIRQQYLVPPGDGGCYL